MTLQQTNYQKKLLDPRWQKRRLEILNRDNFTCTHCFNDKDTLHVHHTYYEKDLEPWEAKEEHLTTLCDKCHKSFHMTLPALHYQILDVIKSKLKDPFITRCFYELLLNSNTPDELIYLLWENRQKESEIIENLRVLAFPDPFYLGSDIIETIANATN